MCLSRLDRETGVITVTAPCSWASVGYRLYTIASAESYGVEPADWMLRLLNPLPGAPRLNEPALTNSVGRRTYPVARPSRSSQEGALALGVLRARDANSALEARTVGRL